MDPLSIAASASSIAGVCGTLINSVAKFVVDAQGVSETLQEFHRNIKALQSTLNNVDSIISKRSEPLPFARLQEDKHWSDIKTVLDACGTCLYRLNNELPQLRQNSHRQIVKARTQLEMCLSKDTIIQIQGHLSSYTQVLQLSLQTMSLGSLWETQQSQDVIQTKIEELTEELRQANARWQRHHAHIGEDQELNPDHTLAEMLAIRNIEAWRDSAKGLADAVSSYEPEEQSIAERGAGGSIWNDANSAALAQTGPQGLRSIVDGGGSMGNPDSGIDIGDSESDWDPEPDNRSCLSSDILQCQVTVNKEKVNGLIKDGMYVQAEHCHRQGIALRDQLEKVHSVPFSDKVEEEEIMADILLGQRGTKDGVLRAKEILQRLLEVEVQRLQRLPEPGDDDRSRCWRLYSKLSAVYIELGSYDRAKEFAIRALEGWKRLDPMPRNRVRETANLLARVYQLSHEFELAHGLRLWFRDQQLHLADSGVAENPDEKSDHLRLSPNLALQPMVDALRWCKGRGFDIDSPDFCFEVARNGDGKTALHVAVQGEELDMVKQMVDHVADLEVRDNDLCTPLLLACATRNRRITQVLLQHGANIDVQDKDHNSPLHRLQNAKGGVATAKLLFDQEGNALNVDHKNIYDKTALYLASQIGNEMMVNLLLERGADVNCQGPGQCTPLHVAIDYRRLPIVMKLLKHNADITRCDGSMRNALKAAKTTRYGSPDIIRLLQEHEHETRQRRLSHSTLASAVQTRRTSDSSLGRRDTVVSGVSAPSGDSSRPSRFPLRFSRKET